MEQWFDIGTIKLWKDNPNQGDLGAIITSIQTFGYWGMVVVWKNELRGGNHSVVAMRELLKQGWKPKGDGIRESGGAIMVRGVDISHMDKKEANALGIALNRTTRLGYDDPELVSKLLLDIDVRNERLFNATGYDADDLDSMIAVLEYADIEEESMQLEESAQSRVPEFMELKPSDNEWGIPTLRLEWQATEIIEPVIKWGTQARSKIHQGMYHFYTDDYKFSGLVHDPDALISTQVKVVTEINASTHEDTPLALVLGELYLKRWMSAHWGSAGIKLFVDLNVEPRFDKWNLVGVPHGWRSYSIRSLENNEDHLIRANKLARKHAQTDDILFLVIGGRDRVAAFCKSNNWLHIPEDHARVRNENG